MKQISIVLFIVMFSINVNAQKVVEWVSSSRDAQWTVQKVLKTQVATAKFDAEIKLDKPLQTIDGFGTCFNELGWDALQLLSKKDRNSIFEELFKSGKGANFTICRMPIGANDFVKSWYSYNEIEGDFEMKNFTIDHDLKTLVPFIKSAQQYNPSLNLWASPWSPPTWMKYNKHYALSFASNVNNGLKPNQQGHEGSDMFIQEDKYYQAYSLYFAKFIQSYKAQNITIGMVMPQNEFNSAQVFPSCTWTAKGLSKFTNYLIPAMKALDVKVFLGTVERGNVKLVDTLLSETHGEIKGIGFQWAGKGAVAKVHQNYPEQTLYQSEQECGDGKNDWAYCEYAWSLMKHYLSNGTNAYMYWNTALKQGGISTWGWKQNSLISVDTVNNTFKYNYEYYLIKHFSHYIKQGAKRLETSGYNDVLAFINPDKSIVVVIHNDKKEEKAVAIKIGNKTINPTLKGDSFNTLFIK